MDEITKELLAALKLTEDFLCGPTAWTTEQEDNLIEKVSCAIAKAESAMAEPQPDADGWIKWDGGGCPVRRDALVWVRLRDGYEECDDAATFRWRHVGDDACDQFAVEEGDIIAYRIVNTNQQ